MAKNYWGYRINQNQIDFFLSELKQGRLRQGWGWDEKQCLTDLKMDNGAKRNLPIFNRVKKGDVLLVPRLPSWNEVAVVEATEDFDKGYQFQIEPNLKDYGHIFPAKLIKQFARKNIFVSGEIRSTLKNVARFWNISHYADKVDYIIRQEDNELKSEISFQNRFYKVLASSIKSCFDEKRFYNDFYEGLSESLSNEEWEYALVEGLREIYPPPIVVERTGGKLEAKHGTDILIRFPGLSGYQYAIAIQVKDYSGFMSDSAIEQVSKADNYWSNEGLILIDKYVIVTKCKKEENMNVNNNDRSVKFIFTSELRDLLFEIGTSKIGVEYEIEN